MIKLRVWIILVFSAMFFSPSGRYMKHVAKLPTYTEYYVRTASLDHTSNLAINFPKGDI